jgi:hypothetical protein
MPREAAIVAARSQDLRVATAALAAEVPTMLASSAVGSDAASWIRSRRRKAVSKTASSPRWSGFAETNCLDPSAPRGGAVQREQVNGIFRPMRPELRFQDGEPDPGSPRSARSGRRADHPRRIADGDPVLDRPRQSALH